MGFLFGRTAQNREAEKSKVFCIGLNKTGTTSLEAALARLGYRMGDQARGEMLIGDYARRNFRPILDLCYSADAFQDLPFSCPFTYVVLDQHFPNARFILTVRDSTEQWYNSLVKFHGKVFANGRIPVKEDLQNAAYRYKGFAWEANRAIFSTPEDDLYERSAMYAYYDSHNAAVREYFRFKNNFIEINLSDPGAYRRMCTFLGKTEVENNFPKLNVT